MTALIIAGLVAGGLLALGVLFALVVMTALMCELTVAAWRRSRALRLTRRDWHAIDRMLTRAARCGDGWARVRDTFHDQSRDYTPPDKESQP